MTGVTIEGANEFRRALREMPAQLKAEAAPIVAETSQAVFAGLEAAYPQGATGNLRAGVQLEQAGPLSWRVRSKAKIAFIYEKGTIQRFLARSGANRGVMPAANIFIPFAVRMRAVMIERLKALLVRETGAQVTEESS